MLALDTPDLDDLRARHARHEPTWLDLTDPDEAELAAVAEALGLHPLALEDSRDFEQRPKLDRYEDQMLLVLYGLTTSAGATPQLVEVHVHVIGASVLTISRRPPAQLDRVRRHLHGACSEGELVYRVIDAVVDSLTEGLETVGEEVDAFEETIFDHPRARDRDRMAVLRRSLNGLRRTLMVQRQVFPRVAEQVVAISADEEEARAYLADVGDHLSQALDEIDADRESLQGMLDTYSNEVQERLTIVATIFLPLTALTGFFGTNFQWMLDHIGSAWAFFTFGVGGTLLSCLAIVLWLRRTGLLDRTPPQD
ncbi:magnesium transporter CorA family protein [Actinomycetospora sp. NBRC 106378]|uniref:magnesium transporter CorA family protein n=1 Tax=Actinomycetospora sp. NBRC 106378 TaxID=3032208 RepID=UPI0024A531E0|nr:magnesium transporter CorA family protein [Actinomycetospora sp. NBRC 106378]GLZ55646.1 cobalt/magnesium transport protein CorA [Actinomycetospora sp. NBRC 106378]